MSRARNTRRGRTRGTLKIIAALLMASAFVRLGEGVGRAVARADETVSPVAEKGTDCERPEDLQVLLDELQAREARLEKRETAFDDRMAALTLADQQIDRKFEELSEAEDRLRRTLSIAETAAEDDIERLTRVYETMKPRQAAALFERMDARFAAGFLARMRPEAAAEIMAGLTPEAAHMFSVVLAGRNADAE